MPQGRNITDGAEPSASAAARGVGRGAVVVLAGFLALGACSSSLVTATLTNAAPVPQPPRPPFPRPGSALPIFLPASPLTPSSAADRGGPAITEFALSRPDVWQPAGARMPVDVAAAPSAGCTGIGRRPGWLAAEDAQDGDPGFAVPPDGGALTVQGYADRSSARCGDAVAVSLSGSPRAVRVEAYRIGGYRKAKARLVWRSGVVRVLPRPLPPVQPGTNLREPRWPASLTVPVTSAWPPGVYLLLIRSGTRVAGPAIPLVVRDDADRAPILFTASTLTWNAYGDWGGYNLYEGQGRTAEARFAARSRVVSLRRPLLGSGYRQLLSMDLPVVLLLDQLAARSGLDVDYTTDVDVDQRPSQLLRHAELVFGGHSEYWTRRAYDALAAARNRGVNLVFLGANNLWWHARLDTVSPGAAEPDQEIVSKTYTGDPTHPADVANHSVLWSQWPEHRDAAGMLGHSHAAIGVHGGYQIMTAPAWMLSGTGLTPGSVLPLAVGNEADGYNPAAANPRNLTVVAAGVLRGSHGPVTVSASYYVATSGAAVFSAGTTDWACGISGACFDQRVPAATSAALRAITGNVVLALTGIRAGRTHPSTPAVTPAPAALLAQLAPAAIGSYGGGAEGDAARRAGTGQGRATAGGTTSVSPRATSATSRATSASARTTSAASTVKRRPAPRSAAHPAASPRR
ncbi:MAG TPA: N,N-dimethylformamidase beta subunit family domain-containing protein [Kineosporiaceae bacterium]